MRLLPLALCSALAFGSGCGPKVVRESVYKSEIAEVRLRHVEEGGAPVPREFEHPVTIAPVRVAHILASLSYEDREGKPHPVIRNAHVYDVLPTLAWLLDVPLSRELPGRILEEAFTQAYRTEHPASYVAGYGPRGRRLSASRVSSDDAHLDRLRDLGYIE